MKRLLIAATIFVVLRPAPIAAQPAAIEVHEATVVDLRAALTSGRATSAQLVDAYLARITAYEHAGPAINALIRINPNARAEARARDAERAAGRARGALHGIPVIIKDNYDTGDMPTSGGSIALANSQPARDAFVVRKLREAGAIILAKSNLHELAAGITSISSFGGQTRNPYDPARCAGGSSGGTGAAIAASFAAVGWGSDTCGSIRIPSAFGSLFGLRPTQGMISRSGIIPLSHTQDIGGPMARTVSDLAIALDVSTGVDTNDSATFIMRDKPAPSFEAALEKSALRGARIGVFRPYFADTDAEIADSVRAAIEAMRVQGAVIVDVPMAGFDTLIANTGAIPTETKFDLINYLAGVPNAPVRSMREILDRGLYDRQLEARFRSVDTASSADSDWHRKVLARQALLRARMQFVMDSLSLDALAYPTMRQRPVYVGETQLGTTCALSAQSGLPAISMPAGFLGDGLPVGIELMGRAFTDVRLVSIAYAFEQSGARRHAPATTPALVRGVAPAPTILAVQAGSARANAAVRLSYDAPRNVIDWSVSVTGVGANEVQAVVLRRKDNASPTSAANPTRVVLRMSGPNTRTASGSMPVTGADRRAMREGRMTVALFDRSGMSESPLPTNPSIPK